MGTNRRLCLIHRYPQLITPKCHYRYINKRKSPECSSKNSIDSTTFLSLIIFCIFLWVQYWELKSSKQKKNYIFCFKRPCLSCEQNCKSPSIFGEVWKFQDLCHLISNSNFQFWGNLRYSWVHIHFIILSCNQNCRWLNLTFRSFEYSEQQNWLIKYLTPEFMWNGLMKIQAEFYWTQPKNWIYNAIFSWRLKINKNFPVKLYDKGSEIQKKIVSGWYFT